MCVYINNWCVFRIRTLQPTNVKMEAEKMLIVAPQHLSHINTP